MVHATIFGVVGDEMFCSCDYALRLNAFDHTNRHARGKKRILPEVFEIPAVEWGAINVHPRSKDEVYAPRPRVLAHRNTNPTGKFRVPRSSEKNACRVRRCGTIIVDSHRAVGHTKRRNTQARNRTRIEIVDAADEGD